MAKNVINFEDRVKICIGKNDHKFEFLKIPKTWKDDVIIKCKKCGKEETRKSAGFFKDYDCIKKCKNCELKIIKPKYNIDDAFQIFKDRGYNLIEKHYENCKTKMKYYCHYCDSYNEMSLDNMKRGKGCPNCAIIKKTDEKIKNKIKSFDFKLLEIIRVKCEKIGNTSITVKLECDLGHKFSVRWETIRNKKTYKCKVCKGQAPTKDGKPKAQIKQEVEKYIKDNNLNYEFIDSYKFEYNNTSNSNRRYRTFTKLILNCKKHGIYEVEKSYFMNGTICAKCMAENFAFDIEDIKKEVEDITYGHYKFASKKYTNMKVKYKFLHLDCGNIFSTTSENFLRNGTRCPYCNNMSNGEKLMFDFLKSKNIKFKTEYKFSDCRNINPLPFDFGIFDNFWNLKFVIEVDGGFHRDVVIMNNSITKDKAIKNLKDQQKRDKIKDDYCLDNNIKLYRIEYNKLKDVEDWIKNNKCLFDNI